jgi:hypothetical protein
MLQDTSCASWLSVLESLSPAVAALLSATALWVASRARSTSRDAQSISSDLETALSTPPGMPERRAANRAVQRRRNS